MKIGEAAKLLGVSIQTLRRWDAAGKLQPTVTPGGTRLYSREQLSKINPALATGVKDFRGGYRKVEEDAVATLPHDQKSTSGVLEIAEGRPIINGFQELGNIFVNVPPQELHKETPSSLNSVPKASPFRLWHFVPAVAAVVILVLCLGANWYLNGYEGKILSLRSRMTELASGVSGLSGMNGVLAETTAAQSVEINADTTINGDLTVNGFIGDSVRTGSLYLTSLTKQITLSSGKIISLPDATTTLTGTDTTQTITNKSMSGSSNTFTNIPNSALSNSKVTVTAGTNLSGGGDVSLGSSVTLNLVSNPTFTGSVSAGLLYVNGDATTSGNLLPAQNGGAQNLGSENYYWNSLYVNNIYGPPAGTFWFWKRTNGAVSIANITDDLLIGSAATTSAKIRFPGSLGGDVWFNTGGNFGIGTTAPLATLDVNGNATVSGNLVLNSAASIQTTQNQTLTLGGNSTGNVVIAPNNVTLATFTASNLNLNGAPIINIGHSGTDFGTNGSLTLANALTVSSGGIEVTSGGLTIQSGTLTINDGGGLVFASGQSISSAGTLAVTSGDWGISATGALTGISGINNDGGYTQSGSSTNTLTGATSINNTATISGTLGVGGEA